MTVNCASQCVQASTFLKFFFIIIQKHTFDFIRVYFIQQTKETRESLECERSAIMCEKCNGARLCRGRPLHYMASACVPKDGNRCCLKRTHHILGTSTLSIFLCSFLGNVDTFVPFIFYYAMIVVGCCAQCEKKGATRPTRSTARMHVSQACLATALARE